MAETPSIDTTQIDRTARRLGLTDAKRPLSARIERRAMLLVLGDIPETPLPIDPETTILVAIEGEPSEEARASADAILLLRVAPVDGEAVADPLRENPASGPTAERFHVLDPTVDGSESAFRAVVETAERRARDRFEASIAEAARSMVEEVVPLLISRLKARARILMMCDLIWLLAVAGGFAGAAQLGGAGSGDALHALLVLLARPVMDVPVAGGSMLLGLWLVLVVLGHFWFAAWSGGRAVRRTPESAGRPALDARAAMRRSTAFFRPLFSATPVGWSHSVERRLRTIARGRA